MNSVQANRRAAPSLRIIVLTAFVWVPISANAEDPAGGIALSPAELVAVQPNYPAIYSRIDKPQVVDVSPDRIRALVERFGGDHPIGKKRHGRLPLGITGAIYWDAGDQPAMPIVGFYPDTPASRVLKQGDVIVGANGRFFVEGEDPRIPMGFAIYEAQSEQLGGRLSLTIIRDKKLRHETVELGVTDRYSENWPFDCPRSKRTLDNAVQYVIDHAEANGDMSSVHGAKGSWWNLLLLLGSGDDAAIELARRDLLTRIPDDASWDEIERMVRTGEYPEGRVPPGKASWRLGVELIAVSEYYLLTGDSSVLPIIAYQSGWLQRGQSPTSGSWCHGLNFGGYGEVNSAGLGCFLGLALASKTPAAAEGDALAKSTAFFKKFVGGGIPYGDHPPEPFRQSDNGKNGNAAIAFAVLGDRKTAESFARPTCYTYASREWGHADNCFSFAWGPIGASFAPHAEFRMFLDNQIWYYELARAPYNNGGAIMSMRDGKFNEPFAAAGVQGLFLAMPLRRLQILGASQSVFAMTPPPRLRAAVDAYRSKKWETVRREIDQVLASPANLQEIAYARKLRDAFGRLHRNAEYSLQAVRESIASGDRAKAFYQLRSLRLMLGSDTDETVELANQLADMKDEKARLGDERRYDKIRVTERKKLTDPLAEPRK